VRAVVQRVTRASVTVDDEVVGSIGDGLRVLLGVTHDDGPALHGLRIPCRASCRAPTPVPRCWWSASSRSTATPARVLGLSWTAAAPGAVAGSLVEGVVQELRSRRAVVETGRFGAAMQISLVNDGPFTVLLEV
jgi:D-tyrosyl-tRNA(Tyr) deacylase